MKTTVEIKRMNNELIFSYEAEDNSISKTLDEYVRRAVESGSVADLRDANLLNADLRDANLLNADLRDAYMEGVITE